MFFKSKQLLGLDIGSNSMKLASMTISKGKARLEGFYFAQTPENSVESGELKNPPVVSQSIGQMIRQANTKNSKICAGLWGPSIIIKKIQVPKMDLKLLKEQVKFEAEQYIPFNLDEVNIEYHVLKYQNVQSDSLDILIIAAKKETIMGYAEAVESAGLSLNTVDVSGFALANCFLWNYPNPGVQHVGILNIGCSYTNFVALYNKDVSFVRDIPVGGRLYSEDLQKRLGISYEEAENIKLGAANGDTPSEAMDIIHSTTTTVIDEIQRSIDFYMASATTQDAIQKYYISGGSSYIPGLKEALSANMGVEVELLNPFTNITFNPKNITPEYMAQISPYASIAMGLAMRKLGDEG